MSHDVLGPRVLTEEQKQSLANQIDEDMKAIALAMPFFVKKASPGKVFKLCEVPEVGKLEALYLGNRMVRAQVLTDTADWYADFDLVFDREVAGHRPVMRPEHHTSAELLETDAPDPARLAELIGTLREFYTQGQTDH